MPQMTTATTWGHAGKERKCSTLKQKPTQTYHKIDILVTYNIIACKHQIL